MIFLSCPIHASISTDKSDRIFNYLRKNGAFATLKALLIVLMFAAWNIGQAQQSPQVLHSHVRPAVTNGQAAFVGLLPDTQQMNLAIVLPLRNQDQLKTLLGQLYDPSSPNYRHFLTVEQFTDQFGPTAEDYQAVVAFAQANGFTVNDTAANRRVVSISGTVAQINQAFNVTMGIYRHPTEDRTFYSPDHEPSVSLNVAISHISGMNNFSIPHPMVAKSQAGVLSATVSGSGPGGSYLGSDMRAAYYGGTTLTGTGQAVGLLEYGGYNKSDVDLTFSNAGQTYSVPINNVLLDGLTGSSTGDDGEQVLDIVQAIGMAPGLSQVRVYIGNNDAHMLNSMATENICKQLSISWGWLPEDPQTVDTFFQEFAAQGQSAFVASGDYGAFDSAISPFFYPAEDAYVTTVGGTHLTTNGPGGAWSAETVWNSGAYGSGGGISPDSIPIPSWQSGVSTTANGGSTTLRNVPDVAMEGDFDNYSCAQGLCSGGWAGTSFAAPRWAGFMSLVNQQAVEKGNAPLGGVGFINQAIYNLGAGSNYTTDFHDVTSGNNKTTGNQPTWYSATTGYDLTTGWGSPTGQSLIDALTGPQTPGFWLSTSKPSIDIGQGSSATSTITITPIGGFTGGVTLDITSTLPSGVTATWGTNPATGTSVLTLTASSSATPGTSTVTITGTFSDSSGTLTQTTNFTLTVHAPGFRLQASPSAVSLTQGSSATSTVTITPTYGFSGPVSLSASNLPSGVTASFSPSSATGTSTLTLTASSSAAGGTSTITITGTSGTITATTTLSVVVHAPTFSISSSGTVNIGPGTTVKTSFSLFSQYGFAGDVTLSASGLPSGVTASFSPNPVTLSANNIQYVTVTLTANSSTALGTSTVTITGTSGSITTTATFPLVIKTPTFSLSAPGTFDLGQGNSGTTYISVTPSNGFNSNITLSASGLPSGVTASFAPNPTTETSVLTLTASNSAALGTATVTVTGTSGTITQTTTFNLTIHAQSFTLSGPSTVYMGSGSSAISYVYVYGSYGFSGNVTLSTSGLPSGVTATWGTNPTSNTSSLTLKASSSVVPGQYPITITGTSGSLTAQTTFTLIVNAPTFSITAWSIDMGQGVSTNSYLYVNSNYGFTGNVTLSVSGLPSGMTSTFTNNPISVAANGTGSSYLVLTTTSSTPAGTYTLTITGTSGSQTQTRTAQLTIHQPSFNFSGVGYISLGQGLTTTSNVYVNSAYGFSGNVSLTATGLPTGVTASFSPASVNLSSNTGGSSVLTLSAGASVVPGTYTITITGTSGSLTQTSTFTLNIGTPAFTLYAGSTSLGQGASATSNITTYSSYGFSGNINLTVSGLPTGVTGTFSPNPINLNGYSGSSTLTLTADASTAIGSYPVTVTATSGSVTQTTTFTLYVGTPNFSLSTPCCGNSVLQGQTISTYFWINSSYGFNGNVNFTASGLPSGVTATFSPNPGTSSGNINLILTASATATPGISTVTITGTSGSSSASTTFSLTVTSPFALTASPSIVNLYQNGNSETAKIGVAPQSGFSGSINLSISGLPAGVTSSLETNPVITGTSGLLTLTAGNSANIGTTIATITGTYGGTTVTAPLTVNVRAASSTTSTTLKVASGGTDVTTVSAGSPITLTATVTKGSTPLSAGQVQFCDATATYCEDAHLLGTAQLTSAGTASLKFIPGPGNHSYKAVFTGTPTIGPSSSSTSALTVTASTPTSTTISQSGSAGSYALTATVTGEGLTAPSGTVSFRDTSVADAVLKNASLASNPATWTWSNTQSLTTSSAPNAVAVGDFNGDGIVDIAVANNNLYGSLSIQLGKGDGTFTPASASPQTGAYPKSIVAGDFNRDGILDLAVATSDSNNTVTILMGNGDGTFAPAAAISLAASNSSAITAGDFDGDGILDLAVVNSSNGTLSVLMGNGDGTFQAAQKASQTGYSGRGIVSADFNGDGVPDLAVTSSYSGTIIILSGNGDGSFNAISPVLNTNTYSATSIITADFDGDGKPDLAIASNDYNGTLSIWLGDGKGGFIQPSSSTNAGNYPYSLAVGDFNGDGIADLAVTNSVSSGTMTILTGKGDGTFTKAGSTSAPSNPGPVTAADFNGDGVADLVVTNQSTSSAMVITTQITQTSTASVDGISPTGTGVHQINANYLGDSIYGSSTSGSIGLTAALGNPTVTLSPASSSITLAQPLTVTIAVSGSTGYPAPTGSVHLTSGSYSASATLSNGSAAITIPAGTLPLGTDTLTATYTPDTTGASYYNSGYSSTSVTLTKITPTVTATPSASTVTVAQNFTVTVGVSGGSGTPVATGIITLSSGGYSNKQTLASGSTTFALGSGAVPLGNNTFTATYDPDPSGSNTYTKATQSFTEAVTATGTTTPTITVTPASGTITDQQSVKVTVSVAGGSGQATPTGVVALTVGTSSTPQNLSGGSVTFTIAAGSLSSGANTLTASYFGDGTFAAVNGTATVTVSQVVAVPPSPSPVSPGASTTGTITLTAGSTYSGTMNLTCTLTASPTGAQSLPTCSLSPASVTLSAGSNGTTALTVKTTAASTSALLHPSPLKRWGIAGSGSMLAVVLLFGVPSRRRRWISMLLLLVVIAVAGVVGCGGGSGNGSGNGGGGGGSTTPPTTAGNYTFTVTGVDSTNSKITTSAAVNVTVQ